MAALCLCLSYCCFEHHISSFHHLFLSSLVWDDTQFSWFHTHFSTASTLTSVSWHTWSTNVFLNSQTSHRLCCESHPWLRINFSCSLFISIYLFLFFARTQNTHTHTQLCTCTYLYEDFLLLLSTLWIFVHLLGVQRENLILWFIIWNETIKCELTNQIICAAAFPFCPYLSPIKRKMNSLFTPRWAASCVF